MDSGFVFILFKMTVNTVIAGIEPSAFEPFVARCITGVENFIPIFVPGKQFSKLSVIIRKIIKTEPIKDCRI